MSFGLGVGDVVAVLDLLERISYEVRSYRNAPAHIQQVGAEMRLLRSAIDHLLTIEAKEDAETEAQHLIREVAIQCQEPLLSFSQKLWAKEDSRTITNGRAITALHSVKRRLHWCLITKKDVDALREAIMAGMTTINMLLGVQQLFTVKKAMNQDRTYCGNLLEDLSKKSLQAHMASTAALDSSGEIQGLREAFSCAASEQQKLLLIVTERLQELSVRSEALVQRHNLVNDASSKMQLGLTTSLYAVAAVVSHVRQSLTLLGSFSYKLFSKIATDRQILLRIHAMLKCLARVTQAIPLHLSVHFVRLDDALGESWALPYQACQTLSSFKHVLQFVVFESHRPGATRVRLDKFILRTAKSGVILSEANWQDFIRQGSHVLQAMIVERERSSDMACAFPECLSQVKPGSMICTNCRRQTSFQKSGSDQFGLEVKSSSNRQDLKQISSEAYQPQTFGPSSFSEHDMNDDEIRLFRNVHYAQARKPITTIEEAHGILAKHPSCSRTLRYVAVWRICHDGCIETTIDMLQAAAESEPDSMEGWYLLGRAYMHDSISKAPMYQKAYEAYKKAVQRNPACHHVWNSIALFHFRVNRIQDAINDMEKAIRIYQCDPMLWRNLGILYELGRTDYGDAIKAYKEALKYDAADDALTRRYQEIRTCDHESKATEPLTLVMKELDLSTALDIKSQSNSERDRSISDASFIAKVFEQQSF